MTQKLSQKDIFNLIRNLRITKGAYIRHPDQALVTSRICELLHIEKNDSLTKTIKYQLRRFKDLKGDSNSTETVIDASNFIKASISDCSSSQQFQNLSSPPSTSISSESKKRSSSACSITQQSQNLRPSPSTSISSAKKKRKSLEELTSKEHIARRLKPIFDELNTCAKDEDLPISRILGLMLTYCRQKKIKDIGEKLWKDSIDDDIDSSLKMETALAIYNNCNLGRLTYSNMRKILGSGGFKIFPPWVKIRAKQADITPSVKQLPEQNFTGVYFQMCDAIKITVNRILQLPDVELHGNSLHIQIKFGFDGSGSHSIYNQVNNVDTNNITMTMFCLLNATDSSNNVVYEQPLPNSTLSQRPLCLQMGKEDIESLQSLALFNEEIETLKNDGVTVQSGEASIQVYSTIASHMLDGKVFVHN